MTGIVGSKMHTMCALIPLLQLDLLAGPEFLYERILAAHLDADALASLEVDAHGPEADFQLDNVASGDLLHLVVRVEGVLWVQCFGWVCLAVRGAQDTRWAVVYHQVAVVGFGDVGGFGVGCGGPGDVDGNHGFALGVQLPD